MLKSLPFIVLEDGTFNEDGLKALGLPIEFITKSVDDHDVINSYGGWYYTPPTLEQPDLYSFADQNRRAIEKYKLQPIPGKNACYPSVAYYECSDHGADCMTNPGFDEVVRFNTNLVGAFRDMADDPCQEGDERSIYLYVARWRIEVRMGRTPEADRKYAEGVADGSIIVCN